MKKINYDKVEKIVITEVNALTDSKAIGTMFAKNTSLTLYYENKERTFILFDTAFRLKKKSSKFIEAIKKINGNVEVCLNLSARKGSKIELCFVIVLILFPLFLIYQLYKLLF